MMKIECEGDVPEPTMAIVDDEERELSLQIVKHFVKQGAMRGFLYGAGVGVWIWIIGALFGCIIGGVAGMAIGFLDGLVLAAMARRQRHRRGYAGDFLAQANWVAPLLTLTISLLICCGLAIWFDSGAISASSLEIAVVIGIIPACCAAFASWQSVQKMSEWYPQ